METQFLVPWGGSFEELTAVLDGKLLRPEILTAVNAQMLDLAYLVDTAIDGVFYQINVGPLRKHEVSARLTAQTFTEFPDVSLFVSIATRKRFEYEFDDLASYVDRTIDVGNTVIRHLRS